MKKRFILFILTIFAFQIGFAQEMDLRNKVVFNQGKEVPAHVAQRATSNKKVKARTSTEDFEYNYLNWNFTNAGGASNFSNTMRYVLNSRVDTNNIQFTYSAKRISQIFNSMPYGSLQTGEIIQYDATKAQFTLDTLFINAISVRNNMNTTDTFVVKIGHTTIGAGGYTRGYDSVSNVIYLQTEQVILGPNDSIDNYTYAGSPIVFPIGAVPVIILEYFSSVDSNGIAVAHSKNISSCASATSILSNQNRYGISDYVGVVRFSDGPSRLSFYGNSALNIPDEVPCNYYETQTWGIFPIGKVTLDPQVNIISSQSTAANAKFCLGETVNLFANLTGVPGDPDSTKYTWTPATDLSDATIANPVATIGAASRPYTVTAVNGAFQASANVTVSAASLTATFPNTVTLTSCVDTNKSIVVQVTGPTTIGTTPLQRAYTWSSGQTTTTPTLTKVKQGSYTVTISNGLCNTTATTEVKLANNVAVNQLSFDIDPAEPCQNKEVVFTNTSSESETWKYLWKNGTSTFSTLYEPANYKFPTAGNSIRVTLESTFGACFAKLEKIVKVIPSTDAKCKSSISNKDVSDLISVYPNPAPNGEFTLSNATGEAVKLNVIDLLGKVVYTKDLGRSNEYQVAIPNVKSGIYFVEVISNKGTFTQKLNVNANK
jgi:hypothetical protein